MKIDEYGQVHYSIREILEILYHKPDFDLSQISIEETACKQFNKHSQNLLDDMVTLSNHNSLTEDIDDFHKLKQTTWFMPESYKTLDIEKLKKFNLILRKEEFKQSVIRFGFNMKFNKQKRYM